MICGEYACTVDYDPESDFLSFTRPGPLSTGSIVAGAFTVDLHKNDFVGLEIERASSLFASLFGLGLDLSKITGAKVGYREKGNVLVFFFSFACGNREYAKEVLVPKIEPVPIIAGAK